MGSPPEKMPRMKPTIVTPDPASVFATSERCDILESSNVPDDPDCSIARAAVAEDVTTRWHALRNTAERYVILEGRGRAEIGELAPREVRPGDVVRIPAGCRQRIANTGAGVLVFLAICTPRFRQENYQDLES
jgi:mannose-6-phosphate isomerase-like protein (cupin superfamily)